MPQGEYERNDNLNRSKQGIQVKTDYPIKLKLVLISAHSRQETKKMEYRIQTVTMEALNALRRAHA